MTRWVLFPTHDFPLSDFRAVVNAQVRIGRPGLIGELISRYRKPADKAGNQTSVGSGVAAVSLGYAFWAFEFGF